MNYSVAKVYDMLFNAERQVKAKGKISAYPVHKRLRFDHRSTNELYEWIDDHVAISENASILDAGCGVGHTLINLCANGGARKGLGISLSPKETAFAEQVAKSQGLHDRCRFKTCSYNESLDQSFDLIIAIESLKHSESVENSMINLINHLNDNGKLIVIEDFMIGSSNSFFHQTLKRYWALKHFYSEGELISIIQKTEGLTYKVVDFTGDIAISNGKFLKLKVFFTFIVTKLLHVFRKQNVLQIYLGGLCLEWLYHKKHVEYKALIITKSD